ncbi:hypothetical protein VNI00_012622 [Paramarasmius palmivorus]|uniref:Nephrocystin 3-like N-terminal domain-containing protein n=1 Tax=Paramarasmius palmivorus TaxID=297713 RepID=A0AAW0C4Y8_9AGAR
MTDSTTEALRILAQNAAPNACYDSEQRFPPPNCHEGTRLQILEKLSSRIEDKSKANSVLWLHGSAGVGKSAIAQHLAEKYARNGRLGAAFFFSRSDSTRNKLGPLVASIAYQFCKAGSPFRTTLGPAIIDTIRSDPNIFHTSCENQAQQLLVELSCNLHTAATEEQGYPPYIIIIDGLDECIDRAEQERVLAIVRALISRLSSHFSWIILICSRPEPQIRYGFDHHGFIGHLETFDVNSLDNVNHDIHRYLVDNFATLRMKYRHAMGREGSSWPGEDVLDQLVSRADGQFIFAATVIKYLDVDDEPLQDRLDTIMRIYVEQEESPYSALDTLYHQILSTCRDWGKVRALLRLLVTPHHHALAGLAGSVVLSENAPNKVHQETDSFSLLDVEHGSLCTHDPLLRTRDPLYYYPDAQKTRMQNKWRTLERLSDFLNIPVHEVSTLLIRLHSVLQIPNETDRDIQFAHATFTEFLADLNRSGKFYTPAMSKPEYCDCVATLLLRTLAAFAPSYPLYHSESFDSAKHLWFQKLNSANRLVAFSCESWVYYCSKVISPSVDLLGELEKMDIHVIVAISLELNSGLPLDWDNVIKWAKRLRDSRIDVIVEKLEMTMEGMYIAPGTRSYDYLERERMFKGIFHAEQRLLGPREGYHDMADTLMFAELGMPWEHSRSSNSPEYNILIVPRDVISKVSQKLPIVHVTKDNAHAMMGIYNRILGSPSWRDYVANWTLTIINLDPQSPTIRLSLGYVVDRIVTSLRIPVGKSSGGVLLVKKDIVCFATCFKERLAALNLDVEWSEGSFRFIDTARQGNTCDIHDDTRFHDSENTSTPTSDTEQYAPRSPRNVPDVDDRPEGDHNHWRNCCCFQ